MISRQPSAVPPHGEGRGGVVPGAYMRLVRFQGAIEKDSTRSGIQHVVALNVMATYQVKISKQNCIMSKSKQCFLETNHRGEEGDMNRG